ncbi:MAG TPA: glycine betaine ABC transporter substrate-binding protein [Desulfosarcina sp.]|nr:glycine betaine ABC transporter substrate-binding protein [Desulfosarcina sp.]
MSTSFNRTLRVAVLLAALLAFTTAAPAAEHNIKLASVSWTGVTIKTELAMAVLDSLGYEVDNKVLAVPFVYTALDAGDVDVFLGNWMPSMASIADKFFEKGSVIQLVANMPGAKYTLAVPTFCAERGLEDFSDIVKFGEELDYKIHGIEAGNDGNLIIRDMIEKSLFGLGKFDLVPSSEVAMLAEVQSRVKQQRCIVFLGWAPHSMNERIDMTYLTGSTDATFGPNDGTATVWTNVRKGFAEEQPNAARLFANMLFPVSMMNQIMTNLYEDKSLTPRLAGLKWLKANPDGYQKWFEGVTTADGKPGAPAFAAYLEAVR